MSHIMLCLGKCLICPWKEWLFTSCWGQCFSHIMMSNWLTVLSKSPIFLLILYLLILSTIERKMLFLGFVAVGLESAHREPQILTLHIWANHARKLWRFLELLFCTAPIYPVSCLVPDSSCLGSLNLQPLFLPPVRPLFSVWAPLLCEVIWKMFLGRKLKWFWSSPLLYGI